MEHPRLTSRHGSVAPARPRRRTRLAATFAVAAMLAFAGCASNTAGAPGSSSTGRPIHATASTSEATAIGAPDTTPDAGTPITITAGNQTFTATLNDSEVARAFKEMLPVTLPGFRNAGIEYITELDAPLTETGPFYTDVQPGDLVYYNPRDSITIIYAETSSVPTLTKMGQITSDLSAFGNLPDSVDMRIEAG